MVLLEIRPASVCRWDLAVLGEESGVVRAARGLSLATTLIADDGSWGIFFAVEGARWLHAGGALAAPDAMGTAKRCGTVVSYALAPRADSAGLVRLADVLVGSEAAYAAMLGVAPAQLADVLAGYPNLALAAITPPGDAGAFLGRVIRGVLDGDDPGRAAGTGAGIAAMARS